MRSEARKEKQFECLWGRIGTWHGMTHSSTESSYADVHKMYQKQYKRVGKQEKLFYEGTAESQLIETFHPFPDGNL